MTIIFHQIKNRYFNKYILKSETFYGLNVFSRDIGTLSWISVMSQLIRDVSQPYHCEHPIFLKTHHYLVSIILVKDNFYQHLTVTLTFNLIYGAIYFVR